MKIDWIEVLFVGMAVLGCVAFFSVPLAIAYLIYALGRWMLT